MNRNMWLRARTGAAALLFSIAGIALAQQGGAPDPAQMVDRQVSAMKERLKLTDDQVTKVKPIIAESVQKQTEMRKKMTQGQPPSEEQMAEMKKNREETNKKIAEVLTKDQLTEYEKMQSEMRGRGRGGQKKQQ